MKTCETLSSLRLHCRPADGATTFDYSCLRGHLSSCRVLSLSIQEESARDMLDSAPLPPEALDMIAQQCTYVRELGVGMPATLLSKSQQSPDTTCSSMLVQVCRLPQLRVLRLLTQPHVANGMFTDTPADAWPIPDEQLLGQWYSLLDTFAADIMRNIAVWRQNHGCEPVKLVAFGEILSPDYVAQEDELSAVAVPLTCYIAGTQVDAADIAMTAVTRTTAQELEVEGEQYDVVHGLRIELGSEYVEVRNRGGSN